MNAMSPPRKRRLLTSSPIVLRAIFSGILIALASLMVSCASPTESAVECRAHDTSFSAIEARVVDAPIFTAYEISDCSSDIDEHDGNLHDEVCVLKVRPGAKPAPPRGWERAPITFAPIVVREMAEKHKIRIAILYSMGNAVQFYGDDDLARAILYKQVASCDRA
jgi:hypothetical protein